MIEHIGRITVGYVPQWGVIRVVHSVTGQCLREDSCGELNEQGFRAIVQKYRKLMNIA